MREVVIISGKGGTGKTSISASFSYLEGANAITCDCDVDAANMHLLLDANFAHQQNFMSGEIAVIDKDLCTNCGDCYEVCRFDAITPMQEYHQVDNISCEGCWYCSRVCTHDSITMQQQKAGDIFISDIKNGAKMAHAKLGFGAENSGKLVAKVKQEAKMLALKEDKEYVITDGSPGIGCPVISSLSGANLVVLVTEATLSGLHDLKRVHELVKTFNLKSVCIINKADLNDDVTKEIEYFLKKENIELIAKLPYDETFTKSLAKAMPIVEYDPNSKLSIVIKESWEKIKNKIQE
ncbi:MAG TPA: (4Fe-4S)-binding protein [Campylobacterales bacterium]|nr:(4Fe-4S)-binding protein [Campylobacterales bacterium]HHC11422.1 (4Fe-4S)-binding protein [Campylobacterales bacterium]HHD81116.1 (4Fe-4S)-binding protein [Campylobacterales bacterium]